MGAHAHHSKFERISIVYILGSTAHFHKVKCGNSSIDKAIYYYNLAASNNHTESQFRLGYIYQTNNNISKSIHYYILAASNKHPKSLYNLGLIYLNRDIHQSLFYFELAARENYPEAKLFFAKIHLSYQFKISDFNLIIQYLIDASNASIAEAQFFLSFIYESDKFVKQDIEKAIKYYKMAAAKYSQARINLGRIFYEGKYFKRNIKEAIKYFDLAKKEDNNYDAMNYLGIIYQNGIDVPKDIQLAKNNFELAAKEKYAPSLYNLGNIFLNEDNVDKAIEYYEQASNQGYLLADFQLGMIYIDNIYKKYDIEKAIHYFSIAADQNEPNSQFQLGIIYLTNVHIKPNFEKAFYYIRRSAWNNNSMSQYFLGIAYMNGNHEVKQNYREARNYLFRSASKRCGNSLFAYGFLCHEGKVIHQDIEMAIRFYKDASNNNIFNAKNNLGIIYKNGFGDKIAKNIHLAITYFNENINQYGDKISMYNLASIYLYETDNTDKAIDLLKKSNDFSLSKYLLIIALIKRFGFQSEQLTTLFNENINDNVISLISHRSQLIFNFFYNFFKQIDLVYNAFKSPRLSLIIKNNFMEPKKLNDINQIFYNGFDINL
ncbi:hypothetical protein M9Y10_040423 [Tritrichomonas musculus]|uniref:Uncharacterized protein n=1 Tax=Tritrichomonas musculus TaxID=1915356 RepID=A0ABR2GQC8_9EUKA